MPDDSKPSGAEILKRTAQRRRRAWVQRVLIILVLVGGAAAFFWQRAVRSQSSGPRYVTADVKLGALRETVTATGKFKGLGSVDVGAQIFSVSHSYPDRSVDLHFYRCDFAGEPKPMMGQDMEWIARERLRELPFPDADAALIETLSS